MTTSSTTTFNAFGITFLIASRTKMSPSTNNGREMSDSNAKPAAVVTPPAKKLGSTASVPINLDVSDSDELATVEVVHVLCTECNQKINIRDNPLLCSTCKLTKHWWCCVAENEDWYCKTCESEYQAKWKDCKLQETSMQTVTASRKGSKIKLPKYDDGLKQLTLDNYVTTKSLQERYKEELEAAKLEENAAKRRKFIKFACKALDDDNNDDSDMILL